MFSGDKIKKGGKYWLCTGCNQPFALQHKENLIANCGDSNTVYSDLKDLENSTYGAQSAELAKPWEESLGTEYLNSYNRTDQPVKRKIKQPKAVKACGSVLEKINTLNVCDFELRSKFRKA